MQNDENYGTCIFTVNERINHFKENIRVLGRFHEVQHTN